MISKLSQLEYSIDSTTTSIEPYQTLLFDFAAGDFVYVDGNPVVVSETEAIKVWLQKTFKTQKDRFEVYNGTSYGINYEDLIGYRVDFIRMELEREIRDVVKTNPSISSVSNFVITQDDATLIVSFTINLVSGNSYGEELIF